MAIDIEELLRRVVAEVFDADVAVVYSSSPKDAHTHRVEFTSADGRRHAGMTASYEWFDAYVLDIGVSTFLTDYDDDEADKEAALRELALVVRAYLLGAGRVESRRGLIRSHAVLKIDVDGHEWELRAPLFRVVQPTARR